MSSPRKIVVLASGRGSNFQAIAKSIKSGFISPAEIVGLICNLPDAGALKIAKDLGIPSFLVNSNESRRDGKFYRSEYEKKLLEVLLPLKPDWICLAGYMLLMGKTLVRAFNGKIINIHPSLLPKFKGLHAQKQALEAGEKETGCTVHLVTEDLDAGPIILQSKVPILAGDTEESVTERLLPVEHQTYCEALRKLCHQPFRISDNRVVFD